VLPESYKHKLSNVCTVVPPTSVQIT
jgi:hypothetical protein